MFTQVTLIVQSHVPVVQFSVCSLILLLYQIGCWSILSSGVFSIYYSLTPASKSSFQNALFGRSLLLNISFCDMFPMKIVSSHGGKWTNANFAKLNSDRYTSLFTYAILRDMSWY